MMEIWLFWSLQRTSANIPLDRYFKSTRTDGGLVSWQILVNRIFMVFLLDSAGDEDLANGLAD